MIAFKVKVDVGSIKEVARALDGIKEGVKNRVLKQSIGKVARRVAKVAKQGAPEGPTKILKKSIGTRYKSYRRGLVWIYAIGPRSGFRGTASHQPRRRPSIPTFIGHLAERGRGPVRAGSRKSGKKVTATGKTLLAFYPSPTATFRIFKPQVAAARGFKFMQKAYRLVNSPSARLTRFVIEDILTGIDREAAKYAAKGKSIR